MKGVKFIYDSHGETFLFTLHTEMLDRYNFDKSSDKCSICICLKLDVSCKLPRELLFANCSAVLWSTNDNGTIERIRSRMERDNVSHVIVCIIWNEYGYHDVSFCDRRECLGIGWTLDQLVEDQPVWSGVRVRVAWLQVNQRYIYAVCLYMYIKKKKKKKRTHPPECLFFLAKKRKERKGKKSSRSALMRATKAIVNAIITTKLKEKRKRRRKKKKKRKKERRGSQS